LLISRHFPPCLQGPEEQYCCTGKKKQIHGYAASKAQPGTLQLEGLPIYSFRAITSALIKPRYNKVSKNVARAQSEDPDIGPVVDQLLQQWKKSTVRNSDP